MALGSIGSSQPIAAKQQPLIEIRDLPSRQTSNDGAVPENRAPMFGVDSGASLFGSAQSGRLLRRSGLGASASNLTGCCTRRLTLACGAMLRTWLGRVGCIGLGLVLALLALETGLRLTHGEPWYDRLVGEQLRKPPVPYRRNAVGLRDRDYGPSRSESGAS